MKEFLLWIERVLPSLLWSFSLGYKFGRLGMTKVEADLVREKLLAELKKNAEDTENSFIGKSHADIINEAIKLGSDESNGPEPKG